MSFLLWLTKFFEAPKAAPRVPKFVEGTRWCCPRCRKTIASAMRDIYAYEVASASDWFIHDADAFYKRAHCGVRTMRNNGYRDQIFTPTGWAG